MEQPVSSREKLSSKIEFQTTSGRTVPLLPKPQVSIKGHMQPFICNIFY